MDLAILDWLGAAVLLITFGLGCACFMQNELALQRVLGLVSSGILIGVAILVSGRIEMIKTPIGEIRAATRAFEVSKDELATAVSQAEQVAAALELLRHQVEARLAEAEVGIDTTTRQQSAASRRELEQAESEHRRLMREQSEITFMKRPVQKQAEFFNRMAEVEARIGELNEQLETMGNEAADISLGAPVASDQ